MKKVIVIVGPTAIGKSKIGVMLAKKLNTEIISGDSIQVYKGLDICSGKITEEEMQGVPHHLIDILDLGTDYSVCDFQQQARKLIDEIDIPLIVGGTGLYIKACLSDYEFDAKKRDDNFEEKYQDLSNEELYQLLVKYDSKQAEIIHPNNRRRVLRALECALEENKMSDKNKKDNYLYDYFIICLNMDRKKLYERIDSRVEKMFLNGALEENTKLHEKNIHIKGIGYQEFDDYFKGLITLDEVKEQIKLNSHHLAKRQLTWFKHQMDAKFYDVNIDNLSETADIIYEDLKLFLRK